jgi:flagellar biosynthesis protein
VNYKKPLPQPEEKKQQKRAIALSYDPDKDLAPKVLASGKGLIAEQILAIAHKNQLPIKDDPVLVEALAHVEIEGIIPPELYAVVAEVFAFVYRLKEKKKKTL